MKVNERNQDSKEAKKSYLSKICYVFLGLTFAFCVAFIVLTNQKHARSESEFAIPPPLTLGSKDNTTCPVWSLVGDGYCDDEANTPECEYDFNDCCEAENDRSLCQNCTCYLSEIKTEEYKKEFCQNPFYRLGDGYCDLNYNKGQYFFDIGDCCLDVDQTGYSYSHIYANCRMGEYEFTYCPENPCIKSNNFCIPKELGDGICQDHNNGPYCDYDMGDCCLVADQSNHECCNCVCTWSSLDSLDSIFYFG